MSHRARGQGEGERRGKCSLDLLSTLPACTLVWCSAENPIPHFPPCGERCCVPSCPIPVEAALATQCSMSEETVLYIANCFMECEES